MMTDPFEDSTKLKLSLAKHWLDNGHEDLAKSIIRSIVEGGQKPLEGK
jgi:Tfp pilus assembly protein FimV